MNKYENLGKQVAEILLNIKAVFLRPLEPFTWASGIKSPIYCDNRLTLSYPTYRRTLENGLAFLIKENYPEAEVIMGTSTAGIAHAALVSEILDLPMGYVRADNKTHGRNNKIEGVVPKDKKVVVVEDLISTAGSSIEVVNALREVGADVLGIVSIFTYKLKEGIEKLKDADIKNVSLSNIDVLRNVAVNLNFISEKESEMIKKFIDNPADPSWMES